VAAVQAAWDDGEENGSEPGGEAVEDRRLGFAPDRGTFTVS
jgi:hypothetical protein